MLTTVIAVLVLFHLFMGVCAYLAWCVYTGKKCVFSSQPRVGLKPKYHNTYLGFIIVESLLTVCYLMLGWVLLS